MKYVFLFLAVLAVFVWILFTRQTDSVNVEAAQKKASDAVRDHVAVRIDGKDLTRSDIIKNGRVLLQLNMNKSRRKNIRKREICALEKYCKSAVSKEISKYAVARYLHDKNIQVPTGTVMSVTRRFENQYGVMSRKLRRWHNINDLKFMLGKNAHRLDEMIMETARFVAMTNDLIRSADCSISDEQVLKRLDFIKKGNEHVAGVTRDVFEKATNVWKKIISGELAFEAAASKFSEDEYIKEGCDWGCFTRDQLEGEAKLLAILPYLKTGDITPPIESDGGLAILRKDEDDNDRTYSFSRVFFKLPYFYEEENPEQAREYLKKRKQAEMVKSAIDENAAKLKIEYPDGTNMVWKITKQDFK